MISYGLVSLYLVPNEVREPDEGNISQLTSKMAPNETYQE
jgi:hypothetical protein